VSSRYALSIFVLLLACGDDGAAIDAGGRDAGRRDAGPRRDAGSRRDAGRDGGEPVDAAGLDPEWLRLTDVPDPDGCLIDVARRPEHVVPLPRFEPCGAGCRQLVVDWEPPAEGGGRLFARTGYHDGTHAYFAYNRPGRPGERASYLLVAREDGRHLVAFRLHWDISCNLAGLGITDTTFATAVIISNGRLRESRPIRARYDEPVEGWATPSEPRPVINDHVVRTFTSDTTTVYQGGVSARFHRYGPTGAIDEMGAGRDVASATVARDTIILSVAEPTGWQIDFVAPMGTALRELVVPSEGDAWTEATDGVDIVWEQTYQSGATAGYERVELWSSPFTTVASDLRPQRVVVHPTPVVSLHGVGFGRVWTTQLESFGLPLRARVLVQTLDGGDQRV
jgi:hypothetical protein